MLFWAVWNWLFKALLFKVSAMRRTDFGYGMGIAICKTIQPHLIGYNFVRNALRFLQIKFLLTWELEFFCVIYSCTLILAQLLSKSVVYLVHTFFPEVCPIYGLGIIVGNDGCFCRLGYGESLLMNEFDKMSSLLVSNLYVLSHHF